MRPRHLFVVSLSSALAACSPEAAEVDTREPVGEQEDAATAGSVEQAMQSSCSTASVRGLSLQIIAEANCLEPGAFSAVPTRPNLETEGDHVFLFLEQPARDRLVQTLDAHPNRVMSINSMLRTVAQQYLLNRWGALGRCGIGLVATPGASNHETGLAIDIEEWSTWRSALESKGFRWFGSADEVHFDYAGPGAVNHLGLDVVAFQRLWNRNRPNDQIGEDGEWGAQTRSRLAASPAAGFPLGASCDEGGTDEPAPEPGCNAVFRDICSSPSRSDIEWIAARGWTRGCDAERRLFCPAHDLERGQLAALLAVALALPPGPDAFDDDDGSPFEAAIDSLAAAQITAGCGSRKFCPDRTIQRGELAAWFARAFSLPPASDAFDDDDGHPFEDAIDALAGAGIAAGCGPRRFCPDQPVTRAQAATLLRRAVQHIDG